MNYEVLSESDTLAACLNTSLARFGDGELRIAVGGSAISQRADGHLAAELRALLGTPSNTLVGIPNFKRTPNRETWDRYQQGTYADLYRLALYGSSFITRPDNAPWIDGEGYWARVRELWRDKDVALVAGDEKSLTPAMMAEARSVKVFQAPSKHAYEKIGELEEAIGQWSGGPVIMCLGATATALAARLDRRGVHALDLGHIGMFMRHAGAYQFNVGHLRSPDYARQLIEKHAGMKWGKSGASWASEVIPFAKKLGARSVLDYGCGRGTLAPVLTQAGLKCKEYDPGIPGKDKLPKPADLVVCTDVLEHIEPDRIDNVLKHLFLLAARGAFLVIATRPARELLPDGRNAHLIVEGADWWLSKLRTVGWTSMRHDSRKGLCVWVEK